MSAIRLGVGAYLDASFSSTFRSVEEAAKRARKVVEAEGKAGGKAASSAYRDAPAAAKADFGKIGDAALKTSATVEAAAKKSGDALVREFSRGQRAAEASVRRIMSSVGRDMGRFARAGVGTAGSIARGAGVQFDVGAITKTLVDQSSMATKLANQGNQPGVNELQSSDQILAGARRAAIATGRESTEVLAAMGKFVDLTGDLAGARASIEDIAKLANASGTELDDMAAAAGNVKNALDQGFKGSAEQKMAAMNDVMRALAGQGKLGAVEIKDLASQMSKLAAGAGAFAGKREDILGLVGVLAQESRKQGGSASAAQAATAVQAFSRDLTKGKAPTKFHALGIDVFADKSKRQLRSPELIIKEAISKSGGDLTKLATLFPNSMSFRAVKGFANAYTQAGGGKAGDAAVANEFASLKRATMSQAEVERANTAVLETSKAKINQFNEKLLEVGARVADKLTPSLNDIAETGMKVANVFGSLISWAAANPWSAVGLALAASMAKASLGEVVAKGIAKSLTAGSGTAGGGMGALGTLGAALAIASVAVTTFTVGKMFVDDIANDLDKGVNKSIDEDAVALNAINRYNAEVKAGAPTKEAAEGVELARRRTKERIEKAQGPIVDSDSTVVRGAQRNDAEHMPQLLSMLSDLSGAIKNPSKPIEISVNLTMAAPTVDPAGRTGPTILSGTGVGRSGAF